MPMLNTFSNNDLLTESESEEIYLSDDQSNKLDDLLKVDSIDTLRNSQMLALYQGSEYIGDGTFYADSIDTDLPETVNVFIVKLQKKFRKTYTIGDMCDWSIEYVRIKQATRARKPKRKREWKKMEQKHLKTAGKEYVSKANSQSGMKTRPAKQMKKTECKCKYTDCKDLSEEELQEAFTKYYKIKDTRLQKLTLLSNITRVPKKCEYVHAEQTNRPREESRKYYINDKVVCKKLFTNTYAVSSGQIDRIMKKGKSDKNVITEIDGRGMHGHQPKISDDIKNLYQNFPNTPHTMGERKGMVAML